MRSSLSLQRSLFNHQRRQIADSVASPSPAFARYEAAYQAATRGAVEVVTPAVVRDEVARADLVYVGDYHTLRTAQQAYLSLAEHALQSGRRVVLALEFVEGRAQAHLDRYLAGRLGEKAFLQRIGHPYRGPFDVWPHFRPLLELARRERLQVLAIDSRAPGARSLHRRDEYAAARLARAARAADRPLVLVLMGQFHVAPGHLPRATRAALGPVERRHLVVYQNAEAAWWALARRGLAGEAPAVRLGSGDFVIFNASPVVCQRSFLDYVEAEQGDEPLDEPGLAVTFRRLVRDIGRVVGVPTGDLDQQVAVVTAADLDRLEHLLRRARFSADERRRLRRHILDRESAYVPRARVAWLASLSLNHAAEEAAHAVRHAAVGDAMERARPRGEAFWSRALEESLGFFGSRLVNPARRATSLEEWTQLFQTGEGQERQIGAFVLALSAVVAEGGPVPGNLVPRSLPVFHAVSHALGYLLGEALFTAFEAGTLSRQDVRALFRDHFDRPEQAWRELSARFRTSCAPRARHRSARPRAAPPAPIAA